MYLTFDKFNKYILFISHSTFSVHFFVKCINHSKCRICTNEGAIADDKSKQGRHKSCMIELFCYIYLLQRVTVSEFCKTAKMMENISYLLVVRCKKNTYTLIKISFMQPLEYLAKNMKRSCSSILNQQNHVKIFWF